MHASKATGAHRDIASAESASAFPHFRTPSSDFRVSTVALAVDFPLIDSAMKRSVILLVLAVLVANFAGCATPEERQRREAERRREDARWEAEQRRRDKEDAQRDRDYDDYRWHHRYWY